VRTEDNVANLVVFQVARLGHDHHVGTEGGRGLLEGFPFRTATPLDWGLSGPRLAKGSRRSDLPGSPGRPRPPPHTKAHSSSSATHRRLMATSGCQAGRSAVRTSNSLVAREGGGCSGENTPRHGRASDSDCSGAEDTAGTSGRSSAGVCSAMVTVTRWFSRKD